MTSPVDIAFTALCCWRESRNQGAAGMTAVASVIRNRALKRLTSPFSEVTRKLQFSSMTAPSDKQLTLYPVSLDPLWVAAQSIATSVLDGTVPDPTQGATLYFNPDAIQTTKTITLKDGRTVPFPETWNPAALDETVVIGTPPNQHVFFREI